MSKVNEAVIVLAKCGHSHKTYGMRAEKVGINHWRINWAFPIKEASAKREGYDKTTVKGQIKFTDEYPGCPYCGGHQLTVCSCGHIGCTRTNEGVYRCEWCGTTGQIDSYSGEAIIAGMDL